MVDRVALDRYESYEFQTQGQYVVVISINGAVEIYKEDRFLAKLDHLETYSCPANSGSYVIKNISENLHPVLLVRYVLI